MSRSVRAVAHVMRRFSRKKWGGTETVVYQLASHFESEGVRSPIHCTSMLEAPGPEVVGPVNLKRHRYTFPWVGLSDEDRRRLELKGGSPVAPGIFTALLREPGLDLIHTHVQLRLGGMARTAARLRRIPYVVSIHGGLLTTPPEQVEKMKEPFAGKPEWGKAVGLLVGSRHVLRDADAVICVGSDEQVLMQEKFPELRVEYIPNGVRVVDYLDRSDRHFRETARDLGLPEGAPYVLCISRIDYQKNQKLLVEAFARFASSHPRHHLVLIGPVTVEAYEAEIRDLAESAGIADRLILIPGYPPGDDRLASALAGAECFVLPTDHEPFGIVILEAWAAGTPVIATRVGGIPGFTRNGENILHVEQGKVEELAEALTALAASPGRREHLVRGGLAEVQEYDWSRIGERFLALYEELIHVHGRKP